MKIKKNILSLCFFCFFIGAINGYEFIRIPEGNITIGTNDIVFLDIGTSKNYFPYEEHDVFISSFEIGKYLITNEEYFLFRMETGYKTSYELDSDSSKDLGFNNQINKDYPCSKLSVIDAIAYCQWYSDKYGKNKDVYRLPTSSEWEYAAMGYHKQKYPWGNENIILESLGTNEIIKKKNVPITKVKEDMSSFGIRNLMGGTESTLDNFKVIDERYKNLTNINPIIFYSEEGSQFSSRGGYSYNDIADNKGLYFYSWSSIDDWTQPFRMVKDLGTLFNKGQIDECIYYINKGKSKRKKINVYEHPRNNQNIFLQTSQTDFYILFKTIKENNNFYRVMFKSGVGDFGITLWASGWVREEDIKLTYMKWYEN